MKRATIFFDIDDTLYIPQAGIVPPSTLTGLEKLKQAGHTLVIATGRAPFEVPLHIKDLPFDYFITINGNYVTDKFGTVIFSESIPPEAAASILTAASHANIPIGRIYENHATVTHTTPSMLKAFDYYNLTPPAVEATLKTEAPIYQMWFFSEDTEAFESQLDPRLKFVPWRDSGADIILTHTSKATGMQALLERVPNLPRHTVFFGDGYNDIESVQLADIGVAVDNGADALKEVADFVTKDIEDDGIYFACEQLGLFDPVIQQPTLDDYLRLYTKYFHQLKMPQRAIEILMDVLNDFPNDIPLLMEIAALYEFELEAPIEARTYYEKVLELDPEHELALKGIETLKLDI